MGYRSDGGAGWLTSRAARSAIPAIQREYEDPLTQAILQLASQYGRYGYRGAVEPQLDGDGRDTETRCDGR
jgi:hypothetical protein